MARGDLRLLESKQSSQILRRHSNPVPQITNANPNSSAAQGFLARGFFYWCSVRRVLYFVLQPVDWQRASAFLWRGRGLIDEKTITARFTDCVSN